MGEIHQGRISDYPILNRKFVAEGDYIFHENATGDNAYIVQDGAIDLFKKSGEHEVHLVTVRKGGIFGEMALLDETPRFATARAAISTTLIVVGRDALSEKLAENDPFLGDMIKVLVRDIRTVVKFLIDDSSQGLPMDHLRGRPEARKALAG